MKSKILYGVMGIALVSLLIGGGTYAYFSDTETSEGNVFTAGTLDLSVNDTNPWSVPLTLGNMTPGQSTSFGSLTLTNVGSLTGDLYMNITGVVDGGGLAVYPAAGGVSSEPEYVAEGATWDGAAWDATGWAAQDDISTMFTIICNNETGAVSGINGTHLSDPHTYTLIKNNLTAGSGTDLSLNFHLDPAAGNEYQGDNSTFTIQFYLAQHGQMPV
ncbi:MAG: TasA family protein [Methanofollis sp.]|uniref:TasA family protein n=1 Tax=Methanofollis sp. TaxID=2052835 RepID=UPI0026072E03|nr:TasA family protein [Methanofollis sp.]MDD4255014.1 TasA family protein [Methanofollis sp.]